LIAESSGLGAGQPIPPVHLRIHAARRYKRLVDPVRLRVNSGAVTAIAEHFLAG